MDYLEEYYGKIRILEEKRTGRSRADIVMVLPEMICGIEIKSDADSYQRLARQVGRCHVLDMHTYLATFLILIITIGTHEGILRLVEDIEEALMQRQTGTEDGGEHNLF